MSIKRNKKDERIYNKTKAFLEKKNDSNIEEKMKVIDKVLDIEDKEERLSYLYDLICDYLDNEFVQKGICEFSCDICARRRNMIEKGIKKDTYKNGCCYSYMKKRDCPNLNKDGSCKIKNIGCKLFTCSYLRKKGYRYKLNDLYLARYFFNFRQKFYIEGTFFVPKEEIMKGILERG